MVHMVSGEERIILSVYGNLMLIESVKYDCINLIPFDSMRN